MKLQVLVKPLKNGGFVGELAGIREARITADTKEDLIEEIQRYAELWIEGFQDLAIERIGILRSKAKEELDFEVIDVYIE
jgi:predicted RNase H-like HicB family nuclease